MLRKADSKWGGAMQRHLIAGLVAASALSIIGFELAAANLDVPVMEQGGDGQAANCATSAVSGLKPGGDGFLAVRSGPGSQFRKLDELHNGDVVVVFENRGDWAGIVYRTPNFECSSTKTRAVRYKNKGWVHSRWLRPLAG